MRQTWEEHEANHEAFLKYLNRPVTPPSAVMGDRRLGAKTAAAVAIFVMLLVIIFAIRSVG